MAADEFALNLNEHISLRGQQISLEYLLEKMSDKAVLGENSKGIPYPQDAPQVHIPLKEAAKAIIQWGEQGDVIKSRDGEVLNSLLKSSSFRQFSLYLNSLLRARVTLGKNTLSREILREVAKSPQIQAATPPPAGATDHLYNAKFYAEAYDEIYKLTQGGRFPQLAQGFVPENLTKLIDGKVTNQAIVNLIAANLARLHTAPEKIGDTPGITAENTRKLKDAVVAEEVGQIIRETNPELESYLLSLGDPKIAKTIRVYTERLAASYTTASSHTLDELDKAAVSAALVVPALLPGFGELPEEIARALPSTFTQDRQVISRAILRAVVTTSDHPATLSEIVRTARDSLGYDGDISPIISALENTTLGTAILKEQRELLLTRRFHELTPAEAKLVARGINPFIANHGQDNPFGFLTSERAFLAQEASQLIRDTNEAHPGQSVATPQDALQRELSSPAPDLTRIRRLRAHLSRDYTFHELTPEEQRLVGSSRRQRYFRNVASRSQATEFSFFDRWAELEEKLPWNRGLKAVFEGWDKFTEGFHIPGTKIPIFRLQSWLNERFDEWKGKTVLKFITNTQNSQGFFGKISHWALNQYRIGDFDVGLATYRWGRRQLGTGFNWVLSKTTKFATFEALKKASLKTVSNFASKVLLKIGGQAAVKLGAEAVVAIVGFTSFVGTVFGIISAAAMIWEFAKLGWNFLKNYVNNINFREKVNNAVAWGVGALATLNLGTALFTLLGAVAPLIVPAIIGVSIYTVVVQRYQHLLNLTFDLDTGQHATLASGNGCAQVVPASGAILQGSHADYSHSSIVALDIDMPNGTAVRSASNGTVAFTGYKDVYGLRVDIQTSFAGKNLIFIYGHLGSIAVKVGDKVTAGQIIARSNSTSDNSLYANDHLHFEIGGDIEKYSECPLPGTNPAALEGCADKQECNASI